MTVKAADNRYSLVKYGQTKYGPSAQRDGLAYDLSVDWDQDGEFDANESNRVISFSMFRGRRALLSPGGSGAERYEVGRLEVVLDNYDKRYDAWDASGPLYPNIKPGGEVRFRVRDMSDSADPYPVFAGIVADIQPFETNGSHYVRLLAQDGWGWLANTYPMIPIQTAGGYNNWQEPVSRDGLAGMLTHIGWPDRWSYEYLGTGQAYYQRGVNPEIWFYQKGQPASNFWHAYGSALFGVAFISSAGTMKVGQPTFTRASVMTITEDMVHKDIKVNQPWENIRNIVKVFSRHPYPNAVATLYTHPSKPLLGANEILVIDVAYSNASGDKVWAANLSTITPTTDYTANANADGSGADLTANLVIEVEDAGSWARVSIWNNSILDCYLTLFQVRGRAMVSVETDQSLYSPAYPSTQKPAKEISIETNVTVVQSTTTIASDIHDLLSVTRRHMVVKMSGRPSDQFALDIGDVVTCDFPTRGISDQKAAVGGIAMQSQDSMSDVLTTLYLEPYIGM